MFCRYVHNKKSIINISNMQMSYFAYLNIRLKDNVSTLILVPLLLLCIDHRRRYKQFTMLFLYEFN